MGEWELAFGTHCTFPRFHSIVPKEECRFKRKSKQFQVSYNFESDLMSEWVRGSTAHSVRGNKMGPLLFDV